MNEAAREIKLTVGNPKETVLRITPSGKVFWTQDGVEHEAKIDTELAQAFNYTIVKVMGYEPSYVVKAIREGTDFKINMTDEEMAANKSQTKYEPIQ